MVSGMLPVHFYFLPTSLSVSLEFFVRVLSGASTWGVDLNLCPCSPYREPSLVSIIFYQCLVRHFLCVIISLTLKIDIKPAAQSIVCKFFLALNFNQSLVFNYKSHKLHEQICIKSRCGYKCESE